MFLSPHGEPYHPRFVQRVVQFQVRNYLDRVQERSKELKPQPLIFATEAGKCRICWICFSKIWLKTIKECRWCRCDPVTFCDYWIELGILHVIFLDRLLVWRLQRYFSSRWVDFCQSNLFLMESIWVHCWSMNTYRHYPKCETVEISVVFILFR